MGVGGGIANYMGVDPTLVRVGLVILGLITGVVPLLLAYVIAGVVMPEY